jgi:hypothetical protein
MQMQNGRGSKAAALVLMVMCGWCAPAADAFLGGVALPGRVAWSPLARRGSGGAQSCVTHGLRRPVSCTTLRMGFLGWDIGADLGGGKGIRDMLGIIRSGAVPACDTRVSRAPAMRTATPHTSAVSQCAF